MIRRIALLFLCALFALAADALSGKWSLSMDTPGGERLVSPTFVLDGDKVTGKWDQSDVQGTFRDGKLVLEFPLFSAEAGEKSNLKVTATLEGNQLKGSWTWSSYSGSLTGKKQ